MGPSLYQWGMLRSLSSLGPLARSPLYCSVSGVAADTRERKNTIFQGFCIALYQGPALIRTDLHAAVFDTDEIPREHLMGSIEATQTASAQLNDLPIEALRKPS
ncbi:hypothetical protein B7L09_29750 [Pseudomonas mandelii]|nr:hypothetical protein B7L09_29750 [Pseudomonas mandelii]